MINHINSGNDDGGDKYIDIIDILLHGNILYSDISYVDLFKVLNITDDNEIIEKILVTFSLKLKDDFCSTVLLDFVLFFNKLDKIAQLAMLGDLLKVTDNIVENKYNLIKKFFNDVIDLLLNYNNKSKFFLYYGKSILYSIDNKDIQENKNISKDYILEECNGEKGLINLKNGIFESYSEVLSDSDIDISGNLDIKEQSTFMQEMHNPEMIYMINEDLGIDITKLTFQIQVHLLRFLWDQSIEEFEIFKKALLNISGEGNKYAFLTTFLACSEDIELGDKIIELASKPGSDRLFKSYAQLIKLQSEEGFGDFLRIILSRGESMLSNAYNKEPGDELEMEELHLSELVKVGLSMKKIFKGLKDGEKISIDDLNNADIGVKLKLVNGNKLLKNTDILSMMDENNYLNTNFPKKYFDSIMGWIKEAHEDGDKDFFSFALKYMGKDFNNPNSNFLFLEDDEGELMGVCKIEKKGDGSFYYGTHYLREDIRGDFSLGIMLQKILENEVSKGEEIYGATLISNIDILTRQIEFSGGIGDEIITYKDLKYQSKPFLGFIINSKGNYITKNKTLKTKNDFINMESNEIKVEIYDENNFVSKSKRFFSEGFKITRIIEDGTEVFIVYERL